MTIYEHDDEFAGKKIVTWEPGKPVEKLEESVYRIAKEYDAEEEWTDLFAQFLEQPNADQVTGLVIGSWSDEVFDDDSSRVIEALVAVRAKLPRLIALFLGDVTFEESEISWIQQSDVSPLFGAYPALQHFRVRGGNGLAPGTIRSDALKSLVVESGGLDASVVRDVLRSELPALEHLELWLGTDNYGATTTMADLEPLFASDLFPNLRSLGLRDSDLEDEIAQAAAHSPLLERVRVLDLSLGVLTDAGAQALVDSPAVLRLEKLDIHHHYCSEEMVARLEGLGIQVDASDRETPHEWGGEEHRYVAVGE
jgi:hypothetical protein